MPKSILPKCKQVDCKANQAGKCIALNSTYFPGRAECPFYSSKIEEYEKARKERCKNGRKRKNKS